MIGVYSQPLGQRYATSVEAATPEAAEIAAKEEADPGLMVAGVIEGKVTLVDMYTDGYSFGIPNPPGE